MDKLLRQNTKVVAFVRSLLFGYIISGLLLLLIAFLMLKLDLSNTIVSGGIIAVYILSCFVGGLLMGKSGEQKRFLWGLVTGVIYFLILIVISIFMNTLTGMDMGRMVAVFFVCAISGMLGGMFS